MKTLFITFLAATISLPTLSQVTSDTINSLASIHDFCKDKMEGELWFDYNRCDSNSVTLYYQDNTYNFMLTSIAEVIFKPIEKKQRKNTRSPVVSKNRINDISEQKDSVVLVLVTFPAAKIRKEYHHHHSDYINDLGGKVLSDNGLELVNEIYIGGNMKELNEFKFLFESAIAKHAPGKVRRTGL